MTSPAQPDPPLTEGERAELDRLRREAAGWSRTRAGNGGRWLGSSALLVLAALLALASVTTAFLRDEVLDTNQYVATVAPLVHDPAVQSELAALITREVAAAIDLPSQLRQLADEAEELGAPDLLNALVPPAVNGIESFVRTEIGNLLATAEFAQVWEAANRLAHDELVGMLTTGRGQFLTAEGNEIYLDLGAVIAMVRDRLVDAGFTLAEQIPTDLSLQYPVFHSDRLPELQTATYLLNQGRWIFPIATVLLLIGGILVAPSRRAGLLVAAVLLGGAMLLGLAALALARAYYLDHLPAEVSSRDAASAVYDTFFRFYVEVLRTLVTVAIIVAVAAWLGGPGRAPTAIRRGVGRGLDAAAGRLGRVGPSGPVPRFVHRYWQAIEVAVVVAAVAVLVFWRTPGVAGTLWLTAAVLLIVTLVELAARLGNHGAPRRVASARRATTP